MNIELVKLKSKIEEVKDFLNSLKIKEDYNLEEIKSKIEEIFIFAGMYSKPFFYHTFFGDGLVRARKHKKNEELFNYTKDFWYRDWSKDDYENWRFDRLNMPGESVWYFSTRIEACIVETQPEKGNIVSIANIKQISNSKKEFNFLHLGDISKVDASLKKMHEDTDRTLELSELDMQKLNIINDFLDGIFLDKVSNDESYRYLPSIAITRICRNFNYSIRTDGIMYSSVSFGQNAVNVALLNPKIDETNFYVYQTIQFIVTKAEKDKYYEVVPLLVGKNLNENQYGNFPICWKKPRREEIEAYSYRIKINPTL